MNTTESYRRKFVNYAESALRLFADADVTREQVAVLLSLWDGRKQLDDLGGSEELLSRFPAAEPPSVPGLDWLPEVEADADVLVAEAVAVLDEPKPRREFTDVQGDTWFEQPDGALALHAKTSDGSQLVMSRFGVEAEYGPLVEVQPDAEAVTSRHGPCSGLAADKRDNTCTNPAAEYVSYESDAWSDLTCRRLCTPCANAAPNVVTRSPLTTAPGQSLLGLDAKAVPAGLVSNACTCGHSEPEHITGVCMSELTDAEFCPCGAYVRAEAVDRG